MAPDPPERLGHRETEPVSLTEGLDAFRGLMLGAAVGVMIWIAVVVAVVVIL